MAKTNGADLEFVFDGIEYPIISSNIDEQAQKWDGTDSSTESDSKDSEIGRVDRTISVEAFLYNPDGAEIATGTLTAGQKYRVTGGTFTVGGIVYTVGQLFTAAGTETATATNKVKPLGEKINCKGMTVLYDDVARGVSTLTYARTFDKQDTTDNLTTGDGTEYIVTRAEATLGLDAIVRSEEADLFVANAVKKPVVITLQSGTTLSGNVIITGEPKSLSVNDVAKVTPTFDFKGKPTEVNLGLPLNSEKTFKIVVKRGATTNKEYSGTALIEAKTITANCTASDTSAKVSYTIQINGAVTKSVAN
jgi:hypothetical protein